MVDDLGGTRSGFVSKLLLGYTQNHKKEYVQLEHQLTISIGSFHRISVESIRLTPMELNMILTQMVCLVILNIHDL